MNENSSISPDNLKSAGKVIATIGGGTGAAGAIAALIYYLLMQLQTVQNTVSEHTIELKYEKENSEEFRNDKIRLYDKIAEIERKQQSLDSKILLLDQKIVRQSKR